MRERGFFLIGCITLIMGLQTVQGQVILQAVRQGQLDSVRVILSKDPTAVEAKDGAGRTPLHMAANGGHVDIFELLIEKGADPKVKTQANTTTLHYAALGGHLNIVNRLIELGVGLDEKNFQTATPLYYACMNGHLSVVRLLAEKGADIEALDGEQGNALQTAAAGGHLETVRFLIDQGANVDCIDINGRTALYFAGRSGNKELVQLLISKGLDPEVADKFGKNALMAAAEAGHGDLALHLIKSGASVNTKSADGSTLLYGAVVGKQVQLAEAVIAAGVDIHAKNQFEQTAIDLAKAINDSAMVVFLGKKGAKASPIRKYKGTYLGLTPPGDEPILFAPGLVSTSDGNERDVDWTADGNELYFTWWKPRMGWDIMVLRQQGDAWSKPTKASFSSPFLEAEAFLTPDEHQLYFISNRPAGEGAPQNWEIWSSARNGDDWDAPKMLGGAFKGGFYTTFTDAGDMYLTLDNDLQFARKNDSGFDDPVRLSENVNSDQAEYNSFIAMDESYLIFTSTGWSDGEDLHICFRKSDGSWSKAMNMGPSVNSFARDYCPSVSPDGKYFFFSSRRYGTEDIFWMDASIIQTLKEKALGGK